MDRYTLQWAVFCAVLVPLFLRSPGSDPIVVTAAHIALALGLVALADWRERHG